MKIYAESQSGRGHAVRSSLLLLAIFFASCAAPDTQHKIVISTRDQKLALLDRGTLLATYPVSTSKFGLGDRPGSRFTPLGQLQVAEKIGDNAPPGTVFKDRRRTGEVVLANSPGRDPIVTRILWLRGLEAQNAQAFDRCIYIHGTPEEKTIGRPASYGCIRMKASDIAVLYNQIPVRALVQIIPDRLPKVPKARPIPTSTALVVQNQKAIRQQPNSASHLHPVDEEWSQNEADMSTLRSSRENFINYYVH